MLWESVTDYIVCGCKTQAGSSSWKIWEKMLHTMDLKHHILKVYVLFNA